MRRMFRIALAPLAIGLGAAWGCGDSADNVQVERTEAAVKGDQAVQDAMKSFMQSKKGGSKKAAAKAEEAKPAEAKPEEAKTD